ncbi:hypothetical protein BBJ28_00008872 [Nothophytophthora sp. Chile5]|nr:hypothetical protein BBJ28_00008872 [Nothophytophthora sp. Chile5]
MGRNLKAKVSKASAASQQKRRKKSGSAARSRSSPAVSGMAAGSGSPVPSATSSSGGNSTPGHGRECEQCGNNLVLDGVSKAWPVAAAKKSAVSTGCQICDFVAFRRSQRPCVQCARSNCDHFCEWCGKGFHVKCAKLRDEDVTNPNGFCCHRCEAEQNDGGDTDDEAKVEEEEEDVGARCGSCRLPFASSGKEEETETRKGKQQAKTAAAGFKVNQAVLVDNDEVLYNALITEVDGRGERIKIHFTRWSKSFDDWYAMDDEHINESLACDCCNQWFHIGCLPPIKSSGRWKDTTYVCPTCIDDARSFHNGNRSVLKAKAAYISTSNAINANVAASTSGKAVHKASSGHSPRPSESAPTATAIKAKKTGKPVVVMDDDDEEMEEQADAKKIDVAKKATAGDEKKDKETVVNKSKEKSVANKKKRKLSEASDSPAKKQESAKPVAPPPTEATASADVTISAGPTPSPSMPESSAPAATSSGTTAANGPASKTSAPGNASEETVTTTSSATAGHAEKHSSPEQAAVKTATEAHSSPSKTAADKIGANKKEQSSAAAKPVERKPPQLPQPKPKPAAAVVDDPYRRRGSCNSVSSILNSPSPNEKPPPTFKPSLASFPMLDPSLSNRRNNTAMPSSSATSMASTSSIAASNFQVYVKMEQKNSQFPLYPRPMQPVKMAPSLMPTTSSSRKDTVPPPSLKPAKAPTARGAKRGPAGAAAGGRGPLSAFDILREVAAQSIGGEMEESPAPVKPKREKRAPASRANNSTANKRAKIDAATSTSTTSASPGATTSPGTTGAGSAAPTDTESLQQTRERIQMNSFVDLHFSIRKEMYLRFCRLEEEGMLTRDAAHLLRSLIYPTSERFQDLKFVYLVNKDQPSVQLTKRLLEAVPYPSNGGKPLVGGVPHAGNSLRSPLGGKGLTGLPMSIGMFSAGLSRNSSSPAAATRMSLLPPPPASMLLRPEPPRSDDASRHTSSGATGQRASVSATHTSTTSTTTKRPDMLLMEQLAPPSRPVPTQQQQQHHAQLLNSR